MHLRDLPPCDKGSPTQSSREASERVGDRSSGIDTPAKSDKFAAFRHCRNGHFERVPRGGIIAHPAPGDELFANVR